jgi:hypothetical protein
MSGRWADVPRPELGDPPSQIAAELIATLTAALARAGYRWRMSDTPDPTLPDPEPDPDTPDDDG